MSTPDPKLQVKVMSVPRESFATPFDDMFKVFLEGIPAASRQDHVTGRKEHPNSFSQAGEFKCVNVHHAACIEPKVNATVGLGFQAELADGRAAIQIGITADGRMMLTTYTPGGMVELLGLALSGVLNAWHQQQHQER